MLTGPVIALAMGERGVLSRILASRFGAFLTFGALSKSRESAPGQPLISDLRARYRSQSQASTTKVTCSSCMLFSSPGRQTKLSSAGGIILLYRHVHRGYVPGQMPYGPMGSC